MPDRLLCLFTQRLRERGDKYLFPVPDGEVTQGQLQPEGAYKVAVIGGEKSSTATAGDEPGESDETRESSKPPVQEGDIHQVVIEDIGDEGDGVARLESGFIVFVPGTEIGDRVTVEITKKLDTAAFGEVVDSG